MRRFLYYPHFIQEEIGTEGEFESRICTFNHSVERRALNKRWRVALMKKVRLLTAKICALIALVVSFLSSK